MSIDLNQLFDPRYYALLNPDLAAAGINTDDKLYRHFRNNGLAEGRPFSPFIDIQVYRAENPDLEQNGLYSNEQLYRHLARNGIREGRKFSRLVDLNLYLAENPDVNQAFGGDRELAFAHLRNLGIREGRKFSQLIDLDYYLALNPDVAAAYNNDKLGAFNHWIFVGRGEGRPYFPNNLGILTGAGNINPVNLVKTDVVGPSDREDYYQFYLNDLSDISIKVAGLSQKANLTLIKDNNGNNFPDDNQQILPVVADGEAIEAIDLFGVSPGNYFIQVSGREGDTNYNLKIYAETAELLRQPSGAGNSPGTALNLGLLTESQVVRDAVYPGRSQNFYQFQTNRQSDVYITLEGVNTDIRLQLVKDTNGNGLLDPGEVVETIANSKEPVDIDRNGEIDLSEFFAWLDGTNQEVLYPDAIIAQNLLPGNYFVQVGQVGEPTGYTLKIDGIPAPVPAGGAGNQSPVAWGNLGIINKKTKPVVTDFVGYGNPYDFYAFFLEKSSEVSLRLQGINNKADLVLIHDINDDGKFSGQEIIKFPFAEDGADYTLNRLLGPGTYYVGVAKEKGETAYTLSAEVISDNLPPDGAGNSLGQAADLGVLSGVQTRRDFVSAEDPDDFYRFQVNDFSQFTLFLDEQTANAQVYLIQDVNGNGLVDPDEVIVGSESQGADREYISRTLTPGSYFIRVNYAMGPGSYYLWMENNPIAPPVQTAGNSLATAKDLGVLNGWRQEAGMVTGNNPSNNQGGDQDHFYRFNLESPSDVTILLDEMSANADIRLVQDGNNNGQIEPEEIIAIAAATGASPEQINQSNLAPGTYYVWVSPTQGNTAYQLNLIPNHYNRNTGYGLVNAAAAVAKAIGAETFAEVPLLGGTDWGLDAIGVPKVWQQGYAGKGVVVAVIDSGIDYTHPDINDNLWFNQNEIPGNGLDDDNNGFIDDWRGWDFLDNDNDPRDTDPVSGHGTHVAGIIAGENNAFGVTGVAPDAKIMAIRSLGVFRGEEDPITGGIRYAVDNGADVINLSLGSQGENPGISEAIRYANEKGVLVVMAAGNDGLNMISAGQRFSQKVYPAQLASEFGLAVGAMEKNQAIADFSNRAGSIPQNYVIAPGKEVYSSLLIDRYDFWEGTSMAAPHIAGVAALILSANPNLNPAQVADLITSTANPLAVTENGIFDPLKL